VPKKKWLNFIEVCQNLIEVEDAVYGGRVQFVGSIRVAQTLSAVDPLPAESELEVESAVETPDSP